MPVKRSVVEIDVRDERFKTFMTSFKQYDAALKKMPGLWQQTAGQSQGMLQTMQSMTAALLAQSDVIRHIKADQTDVSNKTRSMADNWRSMVRYSRETAVNVKQQVGHLLRWTGISAAISGLALGGSVYGIEHLAMAAGAGRRSSAGLGLSYGQQTAFGLSYNRLIDAPSMLHGVSTARGNISSGAAGALFALGMNPTGPGSTGDMSNEALKRIRDLVKRTPDEQLGILVQSHMLGELGQDAESLRRLKHTSDKEFGEYTSNYDKRSKELDVQDRTLKALQDFDVQLETTGQKLKVAFFEGLEKVVGPLGAISEGLSDFVRQFMASDGFKWVINEVAKGLGVFAKYINSPEFHSDIKLFIESIESLARKTVAALRWLNLIPDPGAAATPASPLDSGSGTPSGVSGMGPAPNAGAFYGGIWNSISGGARDLGKRLGIGKFLTSPLSNQAGSAPTSAEMGTYRNAITRNEGSGSYTQTGPVTNSGDRAYGRYQVMGANIPSWTQQALGKSMTIAEFLADPSAQDKVFDHIFGGYVKKYGAEGASRAWFAGEGGMNRLNATDAAPGFKGTTVGNYGRDFAAGLQRQGVTVTVNNNTGGNAQVAVSQMGVVPQ